MRNTQDNRARPGSVIASAVVRAADAASLVGAVRLIARQAGLDITGAMALVAPVGVQA